MAWKSRGQKDIEAAMKDLHRRGADSILIVEKSEVVARVQTTINGMDHGGRVGEEVSNRTTSSLKPDVVRTEHHPVSMCSMNKGKRHKDYSISQNGRDDSVGNSTNKEPLVERENGEKVPPPGTTHIGIDREDFSLLDVSIDSQGTHRARKKRSDKKRKQEIDNHRLRV